MVRFYHGTDKQARQKIEEVGLVPGQFTRGTVQQFVFMSKSSKFAKTFGPDLVEIHLPKSVIYEGNSQPDWIRSGKPVWVKNYKAEALAKGIPKKYIKAVIVNGRRFKTDDESIRRDYEAAVKRLEL